MTFIKERSFCIYFRILKPEKQVNNNLESINFYLIGVEFHAITGTIKDEYFGDSALLVVKEYLDEKILNSV